jgi:hypothetical protein
MTNKKAKPKDPVLSDFKGKTIKDLWMEGEILNIRFTDSSYLDIDLEDRNISTTRQEEVTRVEPVRYTLHEV